MLPKRINVPVVRKRIGTPDAKIVDEAGKIYEELIGFVPPRIEARLNVTGALDPKLVELQEQMRAHAMYPRSFDVKTAQLMLVGMLMMDGSDAAVLHAMAARRAGATWQELQDVISLCFLFRGLGAANKGAEMLANLAAREEEAGGPGEQK
ncbi:carboxymuconolactone decarboxylase family protein [Ramlibacter henchirensis]|uniref:Carboxymuconolactone decarboxylase family protein n=1 Tax=Ramlibacter henchirensis TaxID=204072 RepID=A0A4Z0BV69_9BURK|nr:carboxymuconolactone decarboxylase family protein [Ramlibacter henchirensis]TFZ02612.1 carboxymuconolactone decarboxylase family protein [Ramlibacter henchirensis]